MTRCSGARQASFRCRDVGLLYTMGCTTCCVDITMVIMVVSSYGFLVFICMHNKQQHLTSIIHFPPSSISTHKCSTSVVHHHENNSIVLIISCINHHQSLSATMPYLSKRALQGLKDYQYKPGNYTILDEWHQPIWNCMAGG